MCDTIHYRIRSARVHLEGEIHEMNEWERVGHSNEGTISQ